MGQQVLKIGKFVNFLDIYYNRDSPHNSWQECIM